MTLEQKNVLNELFDNIINDNMNTHDSIAQILEGINRRLGYKINSLDYYLPDEDLDMVSGETIPCDNPGNDSREFHIILDKDWWTNNT